MANPEIAKIMDAMAALAEQKGGGKEKKVHVAEVVKHGTALVVPEGCSDEQAVEILQRKIKADSQETTFSESFDVFPWDGANALNVCLKQLAGFTAREGTFSMFEGYKPPEERAVTVGPNGETVNVPWGKITAPGINGTIMTGAELKRGQLVFTFQATVKRKDEHKIKLLATKMRQYLKEGGSIYQGQAIKLAFHDDDGEKFEGPRILHIDPQFLDLTAANPDRLIFEDVLDRQIKDYCYTHLVYPEACEAMGVAAKRGLLFAGIPGVGKTEVARVAAKLATENKLTVVYCHAAIDFPDCVGFALQYAPSLVICEDIDRVVGGADKGKERDANIDRILNIMDGLETKSKKIKFILTTNDLASIQQPMLRPGRVDACIRFTPPDREAVKGLVRLYAGPRLPPEESLEDAANIMEGSIPAVVAEVVERSKLSAIRRAKGVVPDVKLSGPDITLAAKSIQEQRSLLDRVVTEPDSPMVRAAKINAKSIDGLSESIRFLHKGNPTIAAVAGIAADSLHTRS